MFRCVHCVLRAAGVGGGEAARSLAAEWVSLAGSSVADSSAGVYATGLRRFLAFAGTELQISEDLALPPGRMGQINPFVVCLFLTHCVRRRRLAFKTVEGNVSALADWQRSKGLSGEELISQHPMVKRGLRILKRGCGGAQQKATLPLAVLRQLVVWLFLTSRQHTKRLEECSRDACWLVLGFFGMLRRSELAALTLADVGQLRPEGPVVLSVRSSKTDQQAVGADVHLAALTASGVPIGRIVSRYVQCRRARGAGEADALFASVLQPRAGLSRSWFTQRLRTLLQAMWEGKAGAPDVTRFSAHSLRRGGATAAASAGASIEDIKAHGRWKSDIVRVYIRKSPAQRRKLVACM